jgi:hypothetical protein
MESMSSRVDLLIEDLHLQDCQDTTIGDAMSRGISGGQVTDLNIYFILNEHDLKCRLFTGQAYEHRHIPRDPPPRPLPRRADQRPRLADRQ